jgi:hypothetical protein
MRLAALALLALLALAGCSSGPAPSGAPTSEDVLVTRPGDYAADQNASTALLPHLHDYWGGASRLVVMDGWPTEPGPGLAGGQEVPIYHYRAPSGHVVPQGAASVEVTFAWTPDTDDIYEAPELWYKTAAENQTRKWGPVESGRLAVINTTNAQDDLPHQLLSAWTFEFRLSQRSDLQVLRFKANVTLHVEAVRGLPIPLYPGHPDRWGGQDNITLIDVTRQVVYMQDPGDAGCDGLACPQVDVPRNGTIVPPDAAYVEARLASTYPGTSVGLSYHGAEGRAFQRLQPTGTAGLVRTYEIPVNGYGDGPYATASQWEFAPFIEGPLPDGFAAQEYRLTVVVHHFDRLPT